jgi:hypothetical protein
MARKRSNRGEDSAGGSILIGTFGRKLQSRRVLRIELPEFLICALEVRLAEANDGASVEERSTLDHLIESELVNLISLRDVAELEIAVPGFSGAVRQWLIEVGE